MSVLDDFYGWIYHNFTNILFLTITCIVVFLVYNFLIRRLSRLKEEGKLKEDVVFTLTRIFKWGSVLLILAVVLAQFGVEAGIIAGLMALAGGTIIGFAAMNTIGNAIAGIIIMVSDPFEVGHRVFFNGQFADVLAIDLIYTRMRTLDNVLVSVPNLELLKSEIENYGEKRTVRRSCSITAGYDLDAESVEAALLEAASKIKGVLKDPKPYVWITDFTNFAAEYTLYVFTNQVKRIREIDANLRKAVLETCKSHGIEIQTPTLIRSIK